MLRYWDLSPAAMTKISAARCPFLPYMSITVTAAALCMHASVCSVLPLLYLQDLSSFLQQQVFPFTIKATVYKEEVEMSKQAGWLKQCFVLCVHVREGSTQYCVTPVGERDLCVCRLTTDVHRIQRDCFVRLFLRMFDSLPLRKGCVFRLLLLWVTVITMMMQLK